MSGFGFPGGPPRPPGGGPGRDGLGLPRGTKSFIDTEGLTPSRQQLHPSPGNESLSGRSRSLPDNQFGRIPRINDPLGLGQLGRSDLDPLAPVGPGTGMLADPRGMRQPPAGAPPGTVPGARFDPFGPVPPQPPNFGGGMPNVPGRDQPPPFSVPNPDHLPITPFSGEEPPVPGQPQRRNPPPFGGPSPDNEQPPPSGYEDMFM